MNSVFCCCVFVAFVRSLISSFYVLYYADRKFSWCSKHFNRLQMSHKSECVLRSVCVLCRRYITIHHV